MVKVLLNILNLNHQIPKFKILLKPESLHYFVVKYLRGYIMIVNKVILLFRKLLTEELLQNVMMFWRKKINNTLF